MEQLAHAESFFSVAMREVWTLEPVKLQSTSIFTRFALADLNDLVRCLMSISFYGHLLVGSHLRDLFRP